MSTSINIQSLNINSIGRDNNNIIKESGIKVDWVYFRTLTLTRLLSAFNGLESEYILEHLGCTTNGIDADVIKVSFGGLDIIYEGNEISAIVMHLGKISKEQFKNSLYHGHNDNELENLLETIYDNATSIEDNSEWKLINLETYKLRIEHQKFNNEGLCGVTLYARKIDNEHIVCFDMSIGQYSYVKQALRVEYIEIKYNDLTLIIDKDYNSYMSIYTKVFNKGYATKINVHHDTLNNDILEFNIGSPNLRLEGTYKNNITRLAFDMQEASKITLITNTNIRYNLKDIMDKLIVLDSIDSDSLGFKNCSLIDKTINHSNLYGLAIELNR